MKREKGFTLVEIAIVLVVIGLLLMGVLKGQEMILNARIRSVINEYNNVASATFIYQDRYRQIPGDDNTAAARWGATATSGDGSRVIEGAWDVVAAAPGVTEGGIFWHHMRNDELVAGVRPNTDPNTFGLPRNAFEGDIGVQQDAFSGVTNIVGLVICQSNIEEQAAIIIDTRIDDGTAAGAGSNSGSLQGGTAVSTADAAPGNYVGVGPLILCREMG
jgi:prepilin-type N-terminal cleavage/methylation domain-containing protein